ncbi:MAG TPA: type ISP restriction/modification enzyme [Mucilaginibacter sp.]
MTISQYVSQVNKLYKTGLSSEHSYRGDLRTLLESIVPSVIVTNEPKRIACGAPDYIITLNEIPVGYIEAKDIGKDLASKDHKEQFERYRKSLNNLIITDYLDFWLYIDGELKTQLKIAKIAGHEIVPVAENFDQFTALIKSFCTHVGQTIKSASKLSVMMADKAKLLAEILERALNSDEENEQDSPLKDQMQAFKDILIHDIKPKEFADIYAQTIAYGMFAARLHDTTLNTFTRQEAAELIPKTNPFLRRLFQHIAAFDLDERIAWVVDALADIFRATDVAAILQNFGKTTQANDPIIHFYETFLAEYDPALRKARGVWYTPEPVVNFIVRAVDDILKTEFNLPNGLADNSKIKIRKKSVTKATADQRSKLKEIETEIEVHKVQILDPATGTGTFLAEVVKQVYSKFKGQQGIWSNYAENHLIPRLNGFELLMASYAMAHLKLDMLLTETGFKSTKNQRFRVYLTNSLEEHHPDTGTLFASWLSGEANEANHIKRDTPVMVVMGNPPYSGESANKGEWIMGLMEDYKKEPNSLKKLNEKNSKFINDDYVKFLRYGQHFIEKNGEGALAFINPHGYLDNPTFRGMRWNLLKTYEKIYTIDLHGNSTKKEISPDGTADVNVFDIKQGVSINLFVRTGKKRAGDLAKVFHKDVYGQREFKYNFLLNNNLTTIDFQELSPIDPYYFFSRKDLTKPNDYVLTFSLPELFPENSLGVLSKNDDLTIAFEKTSLFNRINYLVENEESTIRSKYNIKNDSRDWVLSKAISDLKNNSGTGNFKEIAYRPFDNRHTYFTGVPKGFFAYSQKRIMSNFKSQNWAIISGRQGQAVGSMTWNLAFITNTISDQNIFYRGGGSVFPLYLYRQTDSQLSTDLGQVRIPNLKPSILQKIASLLNLEFVNEKQVSSKTFSPIDIMDYIYAILYAPAYREEYKEFLKIDFPRIPYPKDTSTFWELVKLGGQLRKLHLLESEEVNDYITSYPEDGTNIVSSIKYEAGRVYINDTQYFDRVPLTAWEFYIGGYQPAQKWLKDRKGRELNFDDILHYQKMIVALFETDRIMKEIDLIDFS